MKSASEAKRLGQEDYPITASQMRDLTLQAAGFDPAVVGAFVKKATEKLVAKLDATKTQFFSHEGVVIDQRECEDNGAQIKAAAELIGLGLDVMALRRRSADDAAPKPSINIDLSGWTVQPPTPKDVTNGLPD